MRIYPDTRIPGYPDTRIPGYPDTRIPGYPEGLWKQLLALVVSLKEMKVYSE